MSTSWIHRLFLRLDPHAGAGRLLTMLLLADLVFIAVHLALSDRLLAKPLYSVQTDRGYAEIFQYIKLYWIVLLLAWLGFARRSPILLTWCAVFAGLLCDDILRLHEQLGGFLAGQFALPSVHGLRAQDLGEALVYLAYAGALVAVVVGAHHYDRSNARLISWRLARMIAALAVFAVVIDLLQHALTWGRAGWGLIEDGGEMICVSLILWYVFGLDRACQPLSAQAAA